MNRNLQSQSHWMSVFVTVLLALCVIQVFGQPSSPDAKVKEQEVKAAFLFNFLKYVEWPASSSSETNAPLVVGIANHDLITVPLKKIAEGRTIDGRPLIVRVLREPNSAKNVHALWLGSARGKQQEDWLRAVAGSNVLTIGESELFAQRGGIITFVIEAEKVRFDINMQAAQRNGLKIRAQLQNLARKLRRSE